MIALLQRVTRAYVCVNSEEVGRIGIGLLAFIGVERGDTEVQAERLLQRVLSYRMFADAAGKMNHSVSEQRGGLLLVPQFTLAADTSSGTRAGFSKAATPDEGRRLFDFFVTLARARHSDVATGIFGADMQVHLTNDGPVTFWLQTPPTIPSAAAQKQTALE